MDVVDVVADAVSHPDSSSVVQGEYCIRSTGEGLDVGSRIKNGWHVGTGVGDNAWIGVGVLECERASLSFESSSWSGLQYAGEVGSSFVGTLGNRTGGMRSRGERDGDGERGYVRECGRTNGEGDTASSGTSQGVES
jgi:hypothetical protein